LYTGSTGQATSGSAADGWRGGEIVESMRMLRNGQNDDLPRRLYDILPALRHALHTLWNAATWPGFEAGAAVDCSLK
jgi:hypothetical protein